MLHLVHPEPFVLETANPADLYQHRAEFEHLLRVALGYGDDSPTFTELVAGLERDYRASSFVLIAHPRRQILTGLFPISESSTFAGLPVEHPIVRVRRDHRPLLPLIAREHAAETVHSFFRWLTDSAWRADIVTFDGIAHHHELGAILKRYCAENHPLSAIVTARETPAERITVALSTIGSLILTGSRCLDRAGAAPLDTKKARPFGRARATNGAARATAP